MLRVRLLLISLMEWVVLAGDEVEWGNEQKERLWGRVKREGVEKKKILWVGTGHKWRTYGSDDCIDNADYMDGDDDDDDDGRDLHDVDGGSCWWLGTGRRN